MNALLFGMAILGCDGDKEEAAADSAEATLQPDPSSWSGSTLTSRSRQSRFESTSTSGSTKVAHLRRVRRSP